MRKYTLSGCLILCTSVTLFAKEPAVVGHWDLTVGKPSSTWPGWIGVTEKEGKFEASFQPSAGSVGPVQDLKVEGDKITFNAHGMSIAATVTGDRMEGSVKRNGEDLPLIGKRYVARMDPSGTWQLTLDNGELPTLTMIRGGQGFDGYMTIGGNQGGRVQAKADGGTLTFTGKLPEATGRALAGEISATATFRADRMEGELIGGNGKHKFTGERKRQWEQPVELFNGKDLTGWKPIGDPAKSHWTVVDGILANPEHGANLVNDKPFQDFKIHVEFRVPEKGNSGVYLRGRYEIQVDDAFGKEADVHSCGAIYGRIAPSKNVSKKAGEWQTFDATLIGNVVTVVFNGETIIDNQPIDGITGGALDSNEGGPGPIFLQGDHTAIEYRKVTVTPAKPTVYSLMRFTGQPKSRPQ